MHALLRGPPLSADHAYRSATIITRGPPHSADHAYRTHHHHHRGPPLSADHAYRTRHHHHHRGPPHSADHAYRTHHHHHHQKGFPDTVRNIFIMYMLMVTVAVVISVGTHWAVVSYGGDQKLTLGTGLVPPSVPAVACTCALVQPPLPRRHADVGSVGDLACLDPGPCPVSWVGGWVAP